MAREPNVSPLCLRVWRAIHGLSKVISGAASVEERHGPRLKRITEPSVRLSTRPIGPVGISKVPETMVKVDIPVSSTVRIQPERIRLADLRLRATWVQRDAVARGENTACLARRWMQTQGACQATSKYPVTPTERHFSLFFRNPSHESHASPIVVLFALVFTLSAWQLFERERTLSHRPHIPENPLPVGSSSITRLYHDGGYRRIGYQP